MITHDEAFYIADGLLKSLSNKNYTDAKKALSALSGKVPIGALLLLAAMCLLIVSKKRKGDNSMEDHLLIIQAITLILAIG